VTRSEEGMTLFAAEGMVHEPAQAREVYDVSGAGDTVIATLAVMLAQRAVPAAGDAPGQSRPAWWSANWARRRAALRNWQMP
jgi:sugar/nucleoside kinase (ribokinase family)